jgi:phosphoribosylformimino-5-aminoimidazole carboxamide ribotide isomerase
VQVIPAVDVLGGAVVRLRRGDYDAVTRFGDDPVETALDYMAAGAEIVHVVDLEAARSGGFSADLWRRLGAAGVRFQAAGGVRGAEDAVAAVTAGAARVVTGTAAVWEPERLAEMAAAVGGELLVGAVDVRAGRAHGAGWLDEGRPVAAVIEQVVAAGVGRIMATAVHRDGTMEGPDIELVEEVIAAAAGTPVIASGGVSSLDDVSRLVATGCESVVVGRALLEGRFSLREAQAAARGR